MPKGYGKKLIQSLIGLFICFAISNCFSSVEEAPSLPVAPIWLNRAADFKVPNFSNRTTLLEFLTDGCESCLRLNDTLKYVMTEHKITIIGIFTPTHLNSPSSAQHFLTRLNIHYPVIYDKDGKLFATFGIAVWPTVIVINKKGQVSARLYGLQSPKRLNETIQMASGESS